MPSKPLLFIFTGAIEHTGALIAAYRQALVLGEIANVTLILSDRARITPEQLPGAKLLYLPLAQPSWRKIAAYPFALARSGLALRRTLERHQCERLQINDFYFMEGAVARLLGYRGRIITWIRIHPAVQGGIIAALWLRISRAVSNELVTVSRFLAGALPAHLQPKVLHDPVTVASIQERAHAGRRFVFFGNFIEGKGQDLAIRAFHMVAADYPDAELAFYGSDMGLVKNCTYRNRLERMAKEGPAAGQITFNGFVDDVPAALATAFAALNLSRSESFSLTVQEACAHAVPVIATDSGGPAEIIDDGVTGFLVPIGNVHAVADRMRTLLADPGRARAMGRAAAVLVRERFRTDEFVAGLVDIFDLPVHLRGSGTE